MPANLENSAVATGLEKVSFHSKPKERQCQKKKKKGNAKECSNYRTIALISQWHPTPVLLPGKSNGWRSLVGYSPWGRTESNMTEAT